MSNMEFSTVIAPQHNKMIITDDIYGLPIEVNNNETTTSTSSGPGAITALTAESLTRVDDPAYGSAYDPGRYSTSTFPPIALAGSNLAHEGKIADQIHSTTNEAIRELKKSAAISTDAHEAEMNAIKAVLAEIQNRMGDVFHKNQGHGTFASPTLAESIGSISNNVDALSTKLENNFKILSANDKRLEAYNTALKVDNFVIHTKCTALRDDDIATRRDINALERKINNLEYDIDGLEQDSRETATDRRWREQDHLDCITDCQDLKVAYAKLWAAINELKAGKTQEPSESEKRLLAENAALRRDNAGLQVTVNQLQAELVASRALPTVSTQYAQAPPPVAAQTFATHNNMSGIPLQQYQQQQQRQYGPPFAQYHQPPPNNINTAFPQPANQYGPTQPRQPQQHQQPWGNFSGPGYP